MHRLTIPLGHAKRKKNFKLNLIEAKNVFYKHVDDKRRLKTIERFKNHGRTFAKFILNDCTWGFYAGLKEAIFQYEHKDK